MHIYKELKKLDTKISKNPFKNEVHIETENSQQKKNEISKRHLKNCSTSIAIREMQTKIILVCHLTPV